MLDPVDRYTISGIGYGLGGKVHHAVGASPSIDEAVLPFIIASDAKIEDGKVVGDPTEGARLPAGLHPTAGLRHDVPGRAGCPEFARLVAIGSIRSSRTLVGPGRAA